jgi:recombination protein RecT
MPNQVEGTRNLISQYKGELTASLPSHLQGKSQGWFSAAMAAVRRDPNLLAAVAASPGTFINALSEAAQLGLTPGTPEYYLTPRKMKGGVWEVLGITGYQGDIELMYRAGAVSSVIVETVHENDTFEYVPGLHDRPIHHIDHFGDRGALRGSYAYAIMKDGAVSKVVVASQERIARAIAASPTAQSEYSPWKKDRTSMYLKTAAHDLAKWVPTSAEYRNADTGKVEAPAPRPALPAKAAAPSEPSPPAPPPARPEPAVNRETGEMEDLGESGDYTEPYDPTTEPGWEGGK